MQGQSPSGDASAVSGVSTVTATIDRYVGPATADVSPVEATLWLVVVASVVLDVYTTSLGLSAGLTEGNPLMRWAIDGLGVGGLALAKLLVLGCAGLFRDTVPRYGAVIALGLAVPWALAVVLNVVTLATL
jgi:hypothetical protein